MIYIFWLSGSPHFPSVFFHFTSFPRRAPCFYYNELFPYDQTAPWYGRQSPSPLLESAEIGRRSGRIPEPERHSPASENQRLPPDFLLGNAPAGEPSSASWRFRNSAGSFRSLWGAPVFPRYPGLLALLSAIRRIDRMDSKICLFPCRRNPLGCLQHPALAKLHTKQLEIWKIQRTQWRIAQ